MPPPPDPDVRPPRTRAEEESEVDAWTRAFLGEFNDPADAPRLEVLGVATGENYVPPPDLDEIL